MDKRLLVLITCVAVIALPGLCIAQEAQEAQQALPAPEAAPAQEATEYSYGSVVAVSAAASEITIKEYDWDTDVEVDVTYSIAPNVTIENAASLNDIPAGSNVDIEYIKDAGGKKIAQYISLYKQGAGQPETGAEVEEIPGAESE